MMLQKCLRGDGEEEAMMRVDVKASIVESSETPAARINMNNIHILIHVHACNHLAKTRVKCQKDTIASYDVDLTHDSPRMYLTCCWMVQ